MRYNKRKIRKLINCLQFTNFVVISNCYLFCILIQSIFRILLGLEGKTRIDLCGARSFSRSKVINHSTLDLQIKSTQQIGHLKSILFNLINWVYCFWPCPRTEVQKVFKSISLNLIDDKLIVVATVLMVNKTFF